MTTRRALIRLLALGASVGPVLARRALAGDRPPRGQGALCAEDLRVEWRQAPLGIDTRRPRISWTLRPSEANRRGLEQSSWRVIVASSEAALRSGRGDVWDSGKRSGSAMTAAPDEDLPLAPQTDFYCAAMAWDQDGRAGDWSEPVRFVTGMFEPRQWSARWIAAESEGPLPAGPPPAVDIRPPVEPRPLPLLRRDFQIAKPVRRAIVCVSGLGQYELRLNGQRVGRSVLDPGWTNYRKTVLYNTFDVTASVQRGTNAIGVMLGNGLYNVEKYPGRYTKFSGTFGRPKLILQLKLTLSDGTEQLIVSDAAWRTRPGPIRLSSAYGGEDFDARLEPRGWDRPGGAGNGEQWMPALEVAGPGGRLRAQNEPPIVVARTLRPTRITQPRPGIHVYDLGENFSGWPRISVRGDAGRKLKLLPGERLDSAGLVTQRSMHAAPDREIAFGYTLRGAGTERWHPRFSYSGFRYIQVEGAAPSGQATPGEATLLSLTGEFLHAHLPETGSFDCSDALLVRVHGLIKQALLSNTFSVLTDCPHREKLGWLEQTHLNADTVFYNEDAVTLYEKLLEDMQDSQLADGLVPSIAPEYVAFLNADGSNSAFRDSPEWGAAIVLSPWASYRYSGDRRMLEDGYPAMRGYADYLAARARDHLLDYGLGDWYDTGPKPPGASQLTSPTLTATATYYQMLVAIAGIARILERDSDASQYRQRADSVKEAFNAKLFDPHTNRYDRGSMTASAMPLALGLVPEERRQAVLANLVADIRADVDHVTAGDVGFHYVVAALMENGRGEVLYEVLSRTDCPSYGCQLARGATSLTEAWDANPDKSQNHFILGHAESWFYGGLAGIRFDMSRSAPARIRIAPQVIARVSGASARYRSILGPIGSTWHKRDGHLQLDVEIPPGARAQVVLPVRSPDLIHEGGAPLPRALAITAIQVEGREVSLTVGSGRYSFVVPLDQ